MSACSHFAACLRTESGRIIRSLNLWFTGSSEFESTRSGAHRNSTVALYSFKSPGRWYRLVNFSIRFSNTTISLVEQIFGAFLGYLRSENGEMGIWGHWSFVFWESRLQQADHRNPLPSIQWISNEHQPLPPQLLPHISSTPSALNTKQENKRRWTNQFPLKDPISSPQTWSDQIKICQEVDIAKMNSHPNKALLADQARILTQITDTA